MKSQVQPLITLLPTASGSCKEDKWRVKMEEENRGVEDESQPSIKLGLGIGGSSFCCNTSRSTSDNWQKDKRFDRIYKVEQDDYDDDQVAERDGCRNYSVVMFTGDQREELHRQLIIFKYMVCGLPVPLQLLLPLWRSFSSSSALSSSPFSLRVFRGEIDCHYVMDPEPGRCRRTDGKKWRCYQSVVPNEKYCEKHMHRGRKRSRKLVEASTIEAPNANIKPSNNHDLRLQVPAILHRRSQPLNERTRVVMTSPSLTNTASKSNEKVEASNEGKHNSIMKDRIAAISLGSGLDFSPKSVLKDGKSCPRVESCVNVLDSVLQRCKRTDGKRWQCNNDVLPGKKYCAHHIHRGSRKRTVPMSASRETEVPHVSSSTAKFSGLDTNLNISLPTTRLADPGHNIDDKVAGDGSSSDSSTETTISDESADVSDLIRLSP